MNKLNKIISRMERSKDNIETQLEALINSMGEVCEEVDISKLDVVKREVEIIGNSIIQHNKLIRASDRYEVGDFVIVKDSQDMVGFNITTIEWDEDGFIYDYGYSHDELIKVKDLSDTKTTKKEVSDIALLNNYNNTTTRSVES